MSVPEATPNPDQNPVPQQLGEVPPPHDVLSGDSVLKDSAAIYVTPDTPPVRSPHQVVVAQTGLPLLDIRMPDHVASQGEEGVVVTLLRHPDKGYGLTSNHNKEPIYLAKGSEVVLGREGSDDPVSRELGLIKHSDGRIVSRRQMTITIPLDDDRAIVRDGWIDKNGVPHKSHQGSTIVAAEQDGEHMAEVSGSTALLPELAHERVPSESEQALAAFRKDDDNVVDIRLAPEKTVEARGKTLVLARGASRQPEGDAKDLGGAEGDWQTLLGVLDLPGHPPVCLVRAAGIYHSNSRTRPVEFRQGIAAVAPAAEGREPQLIGFSMSPEREIVLSDDNQKVLAVLRPLTYTGEFEVTSHVPDAHMSLIHNEDVRPEDLPHDRVWKMPFADPDWRERIQPAFKVADGSVGSVRSVS